MLQFDAGTHFADPVFPIHTTNDAQLEKDLVFFSKGKIAAEDAAGVARDVLSLPRRCAECVTELRAFVAAGGHLAGRVRADRTKATFVRLVLDMGGSGGGAGDGGEAEGGDEGLYIGGDNTRISKTKDGVVEIRAEAFDKLARLLRATRRRDAGEAPTLDEIHTHIFCLVARYETLSSYNQQLAVLPALYSHLQKHHGVDFELMGSPLNCFFTHFCSLFGDLEAAFGSRGNFNNLVLEKGFYVINPPFDEEIMRSCTERILAAMEGDDAGALSVLFAVPVWDDPLYAPNPCTALLRASGRISAIERVEKRRARFFDHLLRRYINPCDVYFIMVQNDRGRRAHPLDLAALVARFFN
jgi:hypothetical protein